MDPSTFLSALKRRIEPLVEKSSNSIEVGIINDNCYVSIVSNPIKVSKSEDYSAVCDALQKILKVETTREKGFFGGRDVPDKSYFGIYRQFGWGMTFTKVGIEAKINKSFSKDGSKAQDLFDLLIYAQKVDSRVTNYAEIVSRCLSNLDKSEGSDLVKRMKQGANYVFSEAE